MRTAANRDNDYFMGWEVHRTRMFCGIPGFGVQDQAIQESMGEIADRPGEQLAPSDIMIVRVRRRTRKLVAPGVLPRSSSEPPCISAMRPMAPGR